jgi:hypothetical protein
MRAKPNATGPSDPDCGAAGTAIATGVNLWRYFKGKALARIAKCQIAKSLAPLLAASTMLAGCAMGFEQSRREQAKAKAEVQQIRTERQERDNYALCVSQGALPGTAENLACQLTLAKKQEPPAKPQSPAAKAP